MKTTASFISGFALAIAVGAVAVETSDIGRYQISTDYDGLWIYETVIDTATVESVSRLKVRDRDYEKVSG